MTGSGGTDDSGSAGDGRTGRAQTGGAQTGGASSGGASSGGASSGGASSGGAAYPDVPPDLPPRSRGVIGLLEENCTSCMLCARECPDWCIHIESHTEPGPGAGRGRTRPVLDRFAIDYSLCMYCGICVEVCPFDALFWSPEFEYAEHDIRDLVHERDRLREWTWTVPPPPALDSDVVESAADDAEAGGAEAGGAAVGGAATGGAADDEGERRPGTPR